MFYAGLVIAGLIAIFGIIYCDKPEMPEKVYMLVLFIGTAVSVFLMMAGF